MNNRSRTINTVINIFSSVGTQFILLLLSFVSRTIFIHQLGVEYLGVNGLYTNILSVLSLADLGIGSAMAYTLYKPIAEKDYETLKSLTHFYKKIYRALALIILILGLSLLPFLDFFVTADIDLTKLKIYYVMFLGNAVFSYFIIYKTTLIKADQRGYIINIYKFVFDLVKSLIQIAVLIFTKSFLLYLIIQLLSTILNNLFISRKADKIYPFIKESAPPVDKKTKRVILGHVKDMFIYRIGGVFLNSTDNIIISVLLGTIWVGYYANYALIVGAVVTISGLFFSSFVNSIGNLNTTSPDKSIFIFRSINFLNFWVFGFSSVSIYLLINNFIYLWLGESFVLNQFIVIAIVLNLYIPGMLSGVTNFRNTTGLFKKTKYVFLVTTILNIVLSIILGIQFGLAGVLFATVISRILTNFWYEPYMLHKLIFIQSSKSFFIRQMIYAVTVILSAVIIETIMSNLFENITYSTFIFKTVLVFIFINIIFYIFYRKSEEFIYLKSKVFNIIKSFYKKSK